MFTSNPFAELSASIAPSVMQTYIAAMIILVAFGTIYQKTGEWEMEKAPVYHIVD